MATISQVRIKDATQMSGYSDRDIGAQAINVTVGYDSKGNIITDGKTSPITEKNVAEALVDGLDPISHASNSNKYGVASKAQYGHVKIGGGIDVADGVISVSYGNSAGTVTEGNDSRLSDDRPNPEVITFSDDTTKVEYDGSKKVDITLATLGGAPSSHTSVIANANTLGHVKLSDDYTGATTESGFAASSSGLRAAYTATSTSISNINTKLSSLFTYDSSTGALTINLDAL